MTFRSARQAPPPCCGACASFFRGRRPIAAPARRACGLGCVPMTPDGPPYLGATGVANLFVNAGQGSNGWTQACGCGRVVADIVSGRRPEIDLEGFGVDR